MIVESERCACIFALSELTFADHKQDYDRGLGLTTTGSGPSLLSDVWVPLGYEVCKTAFVARHSVIIIAERVG